MSTKPAAEWVRIGDLLPWERNPKAHPTENVAEIARSIVRFGFTEPIIPWRSRKQVVAGHGRLLAAQMLYREDPGRKLAPDQPGEAATRPEDGLVPVRWIEFLNDHEAAAYAIADNRLTEKNPMDAALVAEIFVELDDAGVSLEGLGYTGEELELMLNPPEEPTEPSASDDDAPPVDDTAHPDSQPGQVYELGPHRLICGDCRNPDHVRRLLGGHKVNLAFTSPPYASQRKYDESSGFMPIPPDEYVTWFDAVQANVREVLAPDGSWFVNIKASSEGIDTDLYVFDLVIAHVRMWGWHFGTEFCWERNGIPGLPVRRFKNQFEPIYQFALNDWKFRPKSVMFESDGVLVYNSINRLARGLRDSQGTEPVKGETIVNGKAYPGNRIPQFHMKTEGNHEAAFPVGLPSFFIKAYTDPGDLVYEPFCGSGTTLIAAAKEGRVCRGMEISPKYCDVIRRRWTRWAKEHGKPVGSGGLE